MRRRWTINFPVFRTVVVAGLDCRHFELTVYELFREVREVCDVRLARHKRTGRPLGMACVEYKQTEAAKLAEALSGSLIGNAILQIRAQAALGFASCA